ncbi:hypothetical protein J5277_29310 [Rhizobium sp. 16-449-1b]|nr:hypothetical protein [Rhizobium sp. 16-449-1b]
MTGTYWTPPVEASLAEIHPLLMAAVLMIPDYQDWSIYSADAYDMASGGPLGSFEVVVDPRTMRAYGYFRAVGSHQPMPRPLRFEGVGDESSAVESFYTLMKDAGHVE